MLQLGMASVLSKIQKRDEKTLGWTDQGGPRDQGLLQPQVVRLAPKTLIERLSLAGGGRYCGSASWAEERGAATAAGWMDEPDSETRVPIISSFLPYFSD